MQQNSSKNPKFFENFSKRFEIVIDKRPQNYVAQKLNVSQNTISAWLRGDIPKQFDALKLLAKEFDVDLHWLITGQSKESDFDIPDEELNKWIHGLAKEIKKLLGRPIDP